MGLFFSGGVRVIAGGIGTRFPSIFSVDAPGADAIDSGEAWVLRGCLGRRGWY